MRWLLFLSRVALICNLCYLVFIIGRYVNVQWINANIISTIVVLALVGILLNLFVTITWLVNVLRNKKTIPFVLGVINFVFLIFQLINSALALL